MLDNLITENLILRKAKREDLKLIWKNVWNDEKLTTYMLWEVTRTKADAEIRMEKTIKYQSDNFAYFVCLKDTDEPIGFAGITERETGTYEETGLCIAEKYQGKGYGKELLSALKQLVFSKLNGKRFIYGCFSTNEASKRVCLAQGFKYLKSEPRVRERDGKKYIIDYYYFDKDMY